LLLFVSPQVIETCLTLQVAIQISPALGFGKIPTFLCDFAGNNNLWFWVYDCIFISTDVVVLIVYELVIVVVDIIV